MNKEFICPLDVGLHGDISQFLVRDCKTPEEAKERLEGLGFVQDDELEYQVSFDRPLFTPEPERRGY
jgi:hypothetical protein